MLTFFNRPFRYPSFRFFNCCGSDHQAVTTHQREASLTASSVDDSLTMRILSQQNTATSVAIVSPKMFLIDKGLNQDASKLYAEAMIQVLEAFQCLVTTSSADVK